MNNDHQAAYITGIGLVTPIGVGRRKFWGSLLANESGVGPITLFDPEGLDVKIAAECTDFEPKDFMDRKTAHRTDRFAQFAVASSLMALDDAGAKEFLERHLERVGAVVGTGIGGAMSRVRTQWEMHNKGLTRVSPFQITKMMPTRALPTAVSSSAFKAHRSPRPWPAAPRLWPWDAA